MYAWIRQMAISNKIYPRVNIIKIDIAINLENHAVAQ